MRPDMNQQNERCTDLYEAILRLEKKKPGECIRFFDDLCAVTELRRRSQRYACGRVPFAGQGLQRDPPRDRRIQRHGQPREPHAELRHRQRAESVREDLAAQSVTADTKE